MLVAAEMARWMAYEEQSYRAERAQREHQAGTLSRWTCVVTFLCFCHIHIHRHDVIDRHSTLRKLPSSTVLFVPPMGVIMYQTKRAVTAWSSAKPSFAE